MFRRALLATVATVALVAGCGDDDGDGSGSSESSVPDAGAEPPPDAGADDEGLGDPLVFVAELTADAEVPGPGDRGATGRVEIESATAGEWCIAMEVEALSADVVDAHIHFGPEGSTGDVVIPIGAPTTTIADTDTWTDVCVPVEDRLADEVVDAPQAFYANVHTSDHPDGAVRGQLEPSSIFDLTLT